MCEIYDLMDFSDWHNAILAPLWSNNQYRKHAESVALIQAGDWNRMIRQLIHHTTLSADYGRYLTPFS